MSIYQDIQHLQARVLKVTPFGLLGNNNSNSYKLFPALPGINSSTSCQITKTSLLPALPNTNLQNFAENLPARCCPTKLTMSPSFPATAASGAHTPGKTKGIMHHCMDHVAPINWTAWRKKGNQGANYQLPWPICMWDLVGFQLLLSSTMKECGSNITSFTFITFFTISISSS